MAADRARAAPLLTSAGHPSLRGVVHQYAGYADVAEPAGQLVLPATTSVVMVLKIADSPYRPPQFVSGVHGSYSVLEGACSPSFLQISLAPLGAYALFGVPMDELNGHLLDLREVLGAAGEHLAERVRDEPTWTQRFAAIDEFLLPRNEDGPTPAPEVRWAWRRLAATRGQAPIGEIARDVGWSHRHLIAKFKQQVGLAPKTAARLIRFEQVWRRLDAKPQSRWDQIAAEAGYADQAHLIRDVREFTGTSPTRLFEQSYVRAVA